MICLKIDIYPKKWFSLLIWFEFIRNACILSRHHICDTARTNRSYGAMITSINYTLLQNWETSVTIT